MVNYHLNHIKEGRLIIKETEIPKPASTTYII